MEGSNPERALCFEVEVPAPVEAVWAAWTTSAGLRSFFAPGAEVEPWPDGRYELYFMPEAPPGMRGADGMRVLAVQPERMLTFSWNAPPSLPLARQQRTFVTVRLWPSKEGTTRVRLVHAGWGEGGEWDAAWSYFERAWGQVVLPRLVQRFATGPVDWEVG